MTRSTTPWTLTLLALLVACASTPAPPSVPPSVPTTQPPPAADAKRQAEFSKSLNSWTGATVQELVAKLGQPTSKTRQPDGTPVYVYAKSAKSGAATTFSCLVRYLLDARSERVTGHQIEGC